MLRQRSWRQFGLAVLEPGSISKRILESDQRLTLTWEMAMQLEKTKMDHLSDEELACWLAFDQLSGTGIGSRKLRTIFEHFQSLVPAWEAGWFDLKEVPGLPEQAIMKFLQKRHEIKPELLLKTLREREVSAYPMCHPNYPKRLKEIHDPPSVLYVLGRFSAQDLKWAVGMVGTRRPTAYGQRLAKEMSRGLAESGVTIISGMAVGIDSLAHRGAIEGGGRTVAVLGCGPDHCYPSSNKPLYKLLASG